MDWTLVYAAIGLVELGALAALVWCLWAIKHSDRLK